MKLGIVIPAYNEEKRIGPTLKEYGAYCEKRKKEIDYRILVAVNNTKDRTVEIVKSYSKKNNKIGYLDLPKGGKGYAVIEGFKKLIAEKCDVIGFVDADMSTKPEAFYDLVANLEKNHGVIASRYLAGARVSPKNTLPRIIASRVYNFVIRAMLVMPYRDTQCGAKIFARESLESCINDIGMTQFAFDIELIYKVKKAGFRIKEHPTVWADKKYATINFWQSGPWMFLAVVRLRLLNSPFKGFVRLYDKILEVIRKIGGKKSENRAGFF